MAQWKEIITEALYPSGIKCIVCDAELPEESRFELCEKCKLPIAETVCSLCGREVVFGNVICDQCKEERLPFAAARSSCVYRDEAATLVHKLKYRDARYLAPVLAEMMFETFTAAEWQVDFITFVPVHKSKRRSRGYNQAELLANELGKRIGKECVPALEKKVKTKSMVRQTRERRRQIVSGAFALAEGADVRGKTVLLVDDVLTTGATASECTRVLKQGGCKEAYVLTFAATPVNATIGKGEKRHETRNKVRAKRL